MVTEKYLCGSEGDKVCMNDGRDNKYALWKFKQEHEGH